MKRLFITALLPFVILTGFLGTVIAKQINKPDKHKTSDTISNDETAVISTRWSDKSAHMGTSADVEFPDPSYSQVDQSITEVINNTEDPAITQVDVTMDITGDINREVDINDYYDIDVYSTDVYGRLGSPINFECEEDFDSATIVLHYDDTKLGDAAEEDLGVLWYDEEGSMFYITQEQAVINTTKNTITLEVENFGTYVMVDLNMWRNPPIELYSTDDIFTDLDDDED